jgi:hypothetical protein
MVIALQARRSTMWHMADLGWIPTVKDWLCHLVPQPWMGRAGKRSREFVLAEEGVAHAMP